MAHRDVGEILPGSHLTEQVLAGEITQLHRGQAYAEEDDTFERGRPISNTTSNGFSTPTTTSSGTTRARSCATVSSQ